ncbi:hypothetical protein HYDPIDRAFT_109181 [Hydnomerulius pinastri MD-312]|nr:hypothetical protein HYDPIDRAFT_109181 [Hydnomerulius pinastri MD-312]
MIFIILDDYTYQLGAKTVVAGLVALLLGLLGCLMSVLALGILWVVPTIGPHSPRQLKGKRRLSPLTRPRPLNALGVTLEPEPIKTESSIPTGSRHSLRRPVSFPNLQKTDSEETARPSTTRHVSFSLEATEAMKSRSPSATSSRFPITPPTIQRRWPSTTSPFAMLKSARSTSSPAVKQSPRVQDLPLRCFDETCECHSRVDEFGLLVGCVDASPTRSSISLSMRKVLSKRRRSSSVSCTPTLVNLDEEGWQNASRRSPGIAKPKLNIPLQQSGEVYRAGFVNPFARKAKSISQSPPNTSTPLPKCRSTFSNPWTPTSDGPSPAPWGSKPMLPSPRDDSPPPARRRLANRITSIFKGPAGASSSSVTVTSSDSPLFVPTPIVKTKRSRVKTKLVARTQPYGPPWNAPMPGQAFLDSPPCTPQVLPAPPHPRKADKEDSRSSASTKKSRRSPAGHVDISLANRQVGRKRSGPISPATLVSELDERLSILQKQQSGELVPSSRDERSNASARTAVEVARKEVCS